jgi:hypothetical protein
MKELISEEQADLIILALSILVTAASLAYAFYQNSKTQKAQRKLLWANAGVGALIGPVIWVFWNNIYNPIENHYGLDSLKALKINFCVAIGFGVLFFLLFTYVPRWVQGSKGSRARR